MENNGWIKLHRCLLSKAIWKCSTPEQKTLLITILLLANHEPSQWIWEGKKYTCEAGEFITSIKALANTSGLTPQIVRTALVKFENLEFLTNKSTNRNRLIKVENWGFYQGFDDDANKQTGKHLTSNQQATNKQLTTNKNDKNVRMKEIYIDSDLNSAFLSFLEMRKTIKKPMTDKAIELAKKKLDDLAGGDKALAIKIIERSVEHCWMSFYPLKDEEPKKPTKPKSNYDFVDLEQKLLAKQRGES